MERSRLCPPFPRVGDRIRTGDLRNHNPAL